jgi:hypothetical protein
MKVAVAGSLPVPPRAAWRALVDWEGQAGWMLDADRVTVLGGVREGVGTRVAVRTRVLGIPAFTEVLEVTRWAPGLGLEVRHSGLLGGHGRWRLRPDGPGSAFLWEEDVRLPLAPLGEVALWCYRPVMRFLMGRSMRRLAAVLAGPVSGEGAGRPGRTP